MSAEFSNQGTFAHPNLIAGDFPIVTEKQTILSGTGSLTAGAVLAQDSGNSNKLVLVNDASIDTASREPYAVLAHDADASAADAEATVYLAAHLNGKELTFGGDDTVADHKAALRTKGIFITDNVGA